MKGKNEIHPIRGRVLGYDSKGNLVYGFGGYIDNHREEIPFILGGASGSGLVDKNGELVAIHYGSNSTLRSYLDNPDLVLDSLHTITNVSHMFNYNSDFFEGIGKAVPISKYIKRQ